MFWIIRSSGESGFKAQNRKAIWGNAALNFFKIRHSHTHIFLAPLVWYYRCLMWKGFVSFITTWVFLMDVQLTTCIASFKVHVCAPKLHLAYIIRILFLISSTFCRSLQQNVLLFVCLRKLFQTLPAKLSAVWKKYGHVTPLLKSLSWWSWLLRTNCTIPKLLWPDRSRPWISYIPIKLLPMNMQVTKRTTQNIAKS